MIAGIGVVRPAWVAALCVFAVASAAAQPVATIVGPDTADPGTLVILRTEGTVGSGHTWAVIPSGAAQYFLPIVTTDGEQAAVFATANPGVYVFVLAVAQADQAALATHTLVLGDPGPTPPGPNPPIPPGPAGLRVLILEETAERPALPPAQLSVLVSPIIRGYLDERSAKLDGVPEWRILDDDLTTEQLENLNDSWRAAYADALVRSAGVRPWIHVSNGKAGASVPLPDNIADTLELLKKYGG